MSDWVAAIAPTEMTINNAIADSTSMSPAHVVFGMPLVMPVDMLAGVSPSPAASAFVAQWEAIAKKVGAKLLRAQQYQKKYADARRREVVYDVGDKVLLSTKNLSLKGSKHLKDRYCGPFVVTKKIGATAYKLDLEGKGLDGIHDVFHVSLLRPYASNGFALEV